MQLWMYNNPKIQELKNCFIQNRVKLNGPAKSLLFLKIPKEKYFMHLTLYDLIFQTYKNLNFLFLWNTLSPTLLTNTGLPVNTLFMNIGFDVNRLFTKKAYY